MSSLRKYFDELALNRIRQRKRKSYYWNDITRYCDYFIHQEHKVLEIGCGTAELLAGIKAVKKTGIDFSPAMITEGKKQFPDLDLQLMDAADIRLSENYDVIILSNLVGYLDDVELVFRQLHKVCHPRTKIIVSYYNFLWEPILKLGELVGYKARTPRQNWLSLADINNLLFLAGFETYRNARRILVPVYIPLISEIFNGFFAKLPFISSLCINTFTFAKTAAVAEPQAMSVSVIIPVRNEEGNIENAVRLMPALGSGLEIIFVESNSTDNTAREIENIKGRYPSLNIRSFSISSQGKNAAVRKGFAEAKYEILMILDGDLTVAPADLEKFYHAIASNRGDFINGSRLVYPMEKEAMRFLNLLGNKFFSSVFTWLLDQRLKDTLCGTKVLLRKDYMLLESNRAYFGDFDPFGDFDLLFGAYKLNLCITEVPVRYRERTYGRTNISRFRHGLLLLRMCFFAARKIRFF